MAYLYSKDKCTFQSIIELFNPESIDFSKFNDKNRLKAPSWGLCLEEVIYPKNMLTTKKNEFY